MGCSGFIHGLSVATSLIKSKMSANVALICADTYSHYFSNNNKNKFIFSDAATYGNKKEEEKVLDLFYLDQMEIILIKS